MNNHGKIKTNGSCYCGKINFNMWDVEPTYSVCHCSECRKWTGSFYACFWVRDGNYKINGTQNITWHSQSPKAERGFCKYCGSNLFWRPKPSAGYLDFALGMLDNPSQFTADKHIYCRSKLDYYELPVDQSPKFDVRD